MDYRARIGTRFITRRMGSLLGASLAIAMSILVIEIDDVIFHGLYDAAIRDLVNYVSGDLFIHKQGETITRPEYMLVHWLERTPYVQAATPRLLDYVWSINSTVHGKKIQDTKVPIYIVGIKPEWDSKASTLYQTIVKGSFVTTRDSIVLGDIVDRDLGYPNVGDTVKLRMKDKFGEDVVKRFTIFGIAKTPGRLGPDDKVIVHIDTLRELLKRPGETTAILVKLNDPTKVNYTKQLFLNAFPSSTDRFNGQTIEEAAEVQLSNFRSGIAMIGLIAIFGLVSSGLGVITVQMMQVSQRTRDIGVMRAIGSQRKDILLMFIFQGIVIGALGVAMGTAMTIAFTTYAKETHMQFQGSLVLEIKYDWVGLARTDAMAFSLAIVASIYPAFKATKLEPIEAMRAV